ncbi:MAG: hypothetical protein MJ097_00840 [Dorea sp.]|nr:hypothetical protein [Dorea sp.]
MMTLRELKDVVAVADQKVRVPRPGALFKAGVPIVVKEVVNSSTEIMVFENGYVLYVAGDYSTVFPLHSCAEYKYDGVASTSNVLQGDFFENENWYVRLILEGEDRITENRNKHHENYCVSYSFVSEEWSELEDKSPDFVERLIDQEAIEEALGHVDEKAAKAIFDFYHIGKLQCEIGEDMNMDHKAVSKLIKRNIMKIRKSVGIETEITVGKKEN